MKPIPKFISACCLSAIASAAGAAQWDITMTNLTHGNHFTPVLMTGLDNSTQLFQSGMMASPALRLMAECGDTSELTGAGPAGPLDEDTKTSVLDMPIGPGQSTTLLLDTAMSGNTHLSIVSMILPTNDAFVGMESMQVPVQAGTYTYYLNAYDAATEANNEIVATAQCARGVPGYPIAPAGDAGSGGTGVTTTEAHDKIHIHRGVLGDQDSMGGLSDLNSSIHRWQNPVAKIIITVAP